MIATKTSTYAVRGMTCDHCAASVSEEVGEIVGVEEVSVDLSSGRLEVRGSDVTEDELETAVSEAGYELVGVR